MAKWAINKPLETSTWTISLNSGVNIHYGICSGAQVMDSDIGDKFKSFKPTDYSKFILELDTAGKTEDRKKNGYFASQAEYNTYLATHPEAEYTFITYNGQLP